MTDSTKMSTQMHVYENTEENPEENECDWIIVFEDILDVVFSMLRIKDLKACRLVCRVWARVASTHLRKIGCPIKMLQDRKGIKLNRLIRTMKHRDKTRPLPFSRYHIDLSYEVDEALESFGEFFEMVQEEPSIKELKILYSYRPDRVADVRQAGIRRRGNMTFPSLDYISFVVRFFDEFDPELVNMEEILTTSGGIRKLNVALVSDSEKKPTVLNIVDLLTSPCNKFETLSTFCFDFTFIGDQILQILTEWKQPLQSIALGNFDLKPGVEGAPLKTLYAFLASRSKTLQYLRLKFDKEFPSEALNEIDSLQYEYNNDPFNNPPPPVRNYSRIFAKFPKMESLLSLDIMSPTQREVGWAWRMCQTSFPETFPRLKRFHMINWEYLKGENVEFLPNLKPSMTVEEVRLPDPKHRTDPNVLTGMLALFPKIRSLELNYSLDALEIIFPSLSNLEKLTIHAGDELINFDSVLTGDRTLRTAAMYQGADARNYDLAASRTRPSLLQLSKLKELVLTTEDYHVRISDVAAYHVLLKMKDFNRLTVYANPWEDTTTWMFSSDLVRLMKQTIKFTLHISLSARREKFFI